MTSSRGRWFPMYTWKQSLYGRSIFVAAGASLWLGWSWIAPGRRTRSEALATEGRAVGAIDLGLAVWLLVSELVEGLVTPSTLPAWARLAIGAAVWLAFLGYVFTLGRRAARAGGERGRGRGAVSPGADRSGVVGYHHSL